MLRDFAAAGHQLLVFTCHEHILKLFKSLRVPVSQLPSNSAPGDVVISLERRVEEKPKRERQPSARKPAAKPREPRHDEDEEPVDDSDSHEVEEEYDESEEDEDDDSLWDEDEGPNDLDSDGAAAA